MVDLPIAIRTSAPTDRAFILHSWVKSYRKKAVGTKCTDATYRDYMAGHNAIAEQILAKSRVLVACEKDEPDQIFGYLVYEDPGPKSESYTIHYVYVKVPFRRMGIAKRLYHEAVTDSRPALVASHKPPRLACLARLPQQITYNPYRGYL